MQDVFLFFQSMKELRNWRTVSFVRETVFSHVGAKACNLLYLILSLNRIEISIGFSFRQLDRKNMATVDQLPPYRYIASEAVGSIDQHDFHAPFSWHDAVLLTPSGFRRGIRRVFDKELNDQCRDAGLPHSSDHDNGELCVL